MGPQGCLSRSFAGFEFRASQLEMALKIEEAIAREAPVIVEAGTGTGKTFGYLVPIILSGKKAVVSTGTKNLQEQIFFKDLPLLKKVAHLHVDAMIMKGRKNYLCLHKFYQYYAQTSFFNEDAQAVKNKLDAWVQQTRFGDRAELTWISDNDPLWDALSTTSDQCLGTQCVYFEECFLNKLRNQAAGSSLIIVNHHLFFADLKIKKSGFSEIIPRCQVVLFDEAHHVEEIGTIYFGESVSTHQLTEWVGDMEKKRETLKLPTDTLLKNTVTRLKTSLAEVMGLFEYRDPKGRLDQALVTAMLEGPVPEIQKGLDDIRHQVELKNLYAEAHDIQDKVSFQALLARAAELKHLLDLVFRNQEQNWLTWYEKRKKTVVFHASPLDISENMQALLYQKVRTVAFTSATLATNGNFNYIRSRLNLPEDTLEGIYPSHFDFGSQTLLYLPKDLPLPNEPGFGTAIAHEIFKIISRSRGRGLVLFTSYQNMELVWHLLKDKVPYPLLKQGDAPRSMLLDRFRKDIHSVLLGTASFWQGVDVPGESLSCLIVDKLPFESPGEPLVAAKIDAIRLQGGNPFMEYQLPVAIISLKQGLGRLIRKSSDKGVLCILDKRVIASRYGKRFLDSLPKVTVSHDLGKVGRFFEMHARNQGAFT